MADFKELRKKQGLTQQKLAEKMEVTVNTIQNWEHGRNLPSGDNLKRYLKTLGITNPVDVTRIVGEISTANYNEDCIDELGNVPGFLFADDSQDLLSIKQCYATAEELDMLGYADYISHNGRYAKIEKRGENRYPLEFAFFEKYGGFNATMKKLSEARGRLGKLREDALKFAVNNPGCDYRLVAFDESEIISKLAILLDRKSYANEIEDLYNSLKTIDALGTDFTSNNMGIRIEKTKEINRILQNSLDFMNGERNLGKLAGYVELEMDNSNDKPNINMLKLTERGKQFIQWGDKKHNIK